VDGAVSTLNGAKDTFTGAIGTAATVKTALDTAIGQANTDKSGVTASATDPGVGTKWVLPANLATFNTAIGAAQAVKDNATATQNAVDSAVSTLDTAKGVFNGTVQNVTHGTLPGAITITSWLNEDAAILTTSAGDVTLSRSGANSLPASLTVTVTGAYSAVAWYVNGVAQSGEPITMNAAGYPVGTYRLTVSVTKGSVPYAATINVTVQN
jgi:hypothetical protein